MPTHWKEHGGNHQKHTSQAEQNAILVVVLARTVACAATILQCPFASEKTNSVILFIAKNFPGIRCALRNS